MAVLAIAPRLVALEPVISDDAPLEMPQPGAHKLRILAPDLLELTLITTKKSQDSPPTQWDFIGDQKRLHAPATNAFQVIADGKAVPVLKVGFKRRVLYAPLKQRDLRIGNYLYLQLDGPIANNQSVEVRTADPKLWPATTQFLAVAKPLRWSPAIHVNQTGYLPSLPKVAMVGYYLGSLGEMDLEQALDGKNRPVQIGFQIIDSASDKAVFQGKLTLRGETGFPFAGYQRVFAADFSAFKQPGEYRLSVPGLGSSFPFFISDDVAGAFARAYALGIYHQRCGTANKLPFTRFVHGLCHVAPAEVPTMSASYESVNDVLAKETRDARENPRHTAPPLKNVAASLYPFMNKGPVDVRGGHHDAGDYSKYTANSAAFIHILVFAADNFPGVADLDNLGIPESGDGRS
ncbi:MAG TPA: glycoside hydrolase family 9 protein, partial [Candidatus Paceibacterota bacterium]|nr:glycoside hydrolase family 9 protein [Candidatus Paceibacterota bacterium]